MKNTKFKICPMCEGKIEQKVNVLHHPSRGEIPNVPHSKCQDCGEIFLGRESYQHIHEYDNKPAISA